MGKKIKVGVCTAVINQLSMHRMMDELCREAVKRDFELHIFAPFSNMDHDTNNDRIQQEVYRFLEYEKPEAIVFFADMVKSPDVQKVIIDIAKEKNVPVIGVKSAIDGIYNINYDVDGALRKIVSHLIEDHGCERINFISGNKGNAAFDFRLRAYMRTLEDHGIEVEDKRIMYGGFWEGPTREALDEYFAQGNDMPDAFVCANDAMALAVCKYMHEKGHVIPDEVKVTGIGGIRETEFMTPGLTTAKYDAKITSNYVCDVLEDILRHGKYPTETVRIPCEISYSESCGCTVTEKPGHNETVSGLFERLEKERSFRHDINGIIVATNDECEVDTILKEIPQYIAPVGVKSYGLFLSGKYSFMVDAPICDNLYVDLNELKKQSMESLAEAVPIFLLGTYIDKISENSIRPISLEEYEETLSKIAGENGHVILVPIHSEKELFGFMAVNYDADRIAPEFLYELCVIINLCFDAILKRYKLDLANGQLKTVSEQIILSLAELVEERSEVTGQHVKRVSEYTKILAEGLGLPEDETNMIRIASMMHDVGKITIPTTILDKPGKLTAEEFEVIKTHVSSGEKLMEHAPGPMMERARTIAKYHHEKWNGTGYIGLKGEEIALEARIVALADVFDALVSVRPYKPAFEIEKAVEIITADRGTHFDPQVVDCFLEHLDDFIKIKESYSDVIAI